VKIYLKYHFDAAHKLNLPYESKCTNLHGHRWIVELWLSNGLDQDGMIMDFTKLKSIIDELDHKDITSLISQPTAENIAIWIRERIAEETPADITVRVWETPESYAEI